MNRLLCIALISLASATTLRAQTDMVKVNYSPMSGHILPGVSHNGFNVHDSGHGEDVYAKESYVHAILSGIVTATFSVGTDNCILVSSGDIYIVYSHLKSWLYQKGETITQNALLGYANYSEGDNAFKINVQAWRSRDGKATEDKKLLLALVK